jgi:hypothetical protein
MPEPRESRPPIVTLLAVVYACLGALVLLLAVVVGSRIITWDVKGRLLTGAWLALFSGAVAAVGAMGLLAAQKLWQGSPAGRWLALGFWLAGGSLALITDRSVPGPGEPLHSYLVNLMLLPGGLTALLLWGVPSTRRYFRKIILSSAARSTGDGQVTKGRPV